MLDRIARRLESLKVEKSDLLIVAFSGGPDSTALLHSLIELGYEVVAAHLNHGMRPEAPREADFLRDRCDDLGIPFYVGNANVPLAAKELKIGVEEAGRRARYDFLQRLQRHLGASYIATGHTKDDHVETVFLNIVRGTGLDGLRGIPAIRDGIIRPLLDVTRNETQAFCTTLGVHTLSDPGNDNVDFSRVRVRQRVIPELQMINPSLFDAVVRLSEVVRQEVEFLDGVAARALDETEVHVNGSLSFLTRDTEVNLNRVKLAQWPAPVVSRAVQLVCRSMGSPLDHQQLQAITDSVLNADCVSMTSEGGQVTVTVSFEGVHITDGTQPEAFRQQLEVPGAVDSLEFRWTIATEPGRWSQVERNSLEVFVDASRLRAPVHFRNLEPGDRIVPMGFDKHRKVADLLSEAGLTLAARRRLPIICDMIEPIWVPGVCFSQRVAATALTANPIRMVFGPLERP
ncbi:MAG TPA: tRNA lysidine(34) synthetase TilS [Fimbriimonadaceae bacterium]|nr:tRNA lysidine(34) synthetase TilS [Fimbriimonadaceae bacterium]